MARNILAFLVLFVVTSCASGGGSASSTLDVGPYPSFAAPMQAVDATLAKAAAQDKLAVIVLGANWCHDSKALAESFEHRDMRKLVKEHYEVRLINVGYFTQGYDVAERFGLPVYTHTPTLLIVDPKTGRVINAHDHHQWRDAAKFSLEETVTYFTQKAAGQNLAPVLTMAMKADPDFQRAMVILERFEAKHAARIRTAYLIIGPKLETRPADFREVWEQVAKLRYDLADEMATQRAAVIASGGKSWVPDFPDYPNFPWEE